MKAATALQISGRFRLWYDTVRFRTWNFNWR